MPACVNGASRVADRWFGASVESARFRRLIEDIIKRTPSKHDANWESPPLVTYTEKKTLRGNFPMAEITLGGGGARMFWFAWDPEKKLHSGAGRPLAGGLPFEATLTVDQAVMQLWNFVQYANPNAVRPWNTPAPEVTWSVVQKGMDHSYATEVETFGSKTEAEAHAREVGGAYVVKGTQMWNEPLGQIEESRKPSPYRFIQ